MASERVEYRVVTRGGVSTGWQFRSLREARRDAKYFDEIHPNGKSVPHRVQQRTVTISEWEDVSDGE